MTDPQIWCRHCSCQCKGGFENLFIRGSFPISPGVPEEWLKGDTSQPKWTTSEQKTENTESKPASVSPLPVHGCFRPARRRHLNLPTQTECGALTKECPAFPTPSTPPSLPSYSQSLYRAPKTVPHPRDCVPHAAVLVTAEGSNSWIKTPPPPLRGQALVGAASSSS